ncbi:MAG: tetratricopeptide repeat protein [Candidatus Eisenbacteria bacterium]|nr:tetratricopeptide repeat protein [Candidatus Eisenbacteria bacterium]
MLLLAGLALGAMSLFSGWGCSGPPEQPVLIVGIDGAEWNVLRPLMEAGRLPNLKRLADTGASGPLSSFEPLLSPIIWTTIATGKGPDQHEVLDFTMPDPATGDPIPVVSYQRKAKAFWDILGDRGRRVGVVAWWATWPAEEVNGCIVSDRFTAHAFIESRSAARDVTHPPGLLDDLQPHMLEWRDVPFETAARFMNISQQEFEAHDTFDFQDPITHFRHIHAAMSNVKDAALTVWERCRPEVLAVYFEGVDTASHLFMPHAPPPFPYSSDAERRRYGETVAAVYEYQDRLLGELLQAVGPEARVIIVSDHGFLTGWQRPLDASSSFDYATAARWHRMDGVLIMNGPGIRRGAALESASVFDIFPTLLHLLEMPVGRDMEGQVLQQALSPPERPVETIDSYEDADWTAERNRLAENFSMPTDPELMEKLRSLGYIGGGGSGKAASVRGRLSLAEYFIWKGEQRKAERELRHLQKIAPDFADAPYHLGLLYMEKQEWDEAEAFFRRTLELEPQNLGAHQNLAYILTMQDRHEEALALLRQARDYYPLVPEILINTSIVLREIGRNAEALETLNTALEINPRSHPILAQRALTLEALGRTDEAREAWRRTLEVRPDDRIARSHLEALE